MPLLLAMFLALWGAIAQAQELAVRDEDDSLYSFWEDAASRAEQRIDTADDTSTEDLETLRQRLATFRGEFDLARQANSARIATIRSQINALGPVPENGEESPEIAATRAELAGQFDDLQAPILAADVAFRRADGLINEIDTILRERETRRLLSLGPSPLNPKTWSVAFGDTERILRDLGDDLSGIANTANQRQLRNNLPLVALLLVISLTLIVRGRVWAGKAVNFMRRFGGRGSGVWSFLVSLLRIILPLSGVYILAHAILLTARFGDTIEELIALFPVWGLLLLGFRWLAERLFAREEDDAVICLTPEGRRAGRFYMFVLSVLFLSHGLIAVLFDLEQAAPETLAVIAFPIVVLFGFVLFPMGFMLRKYDLTDESEEAEDHAQKAGVGRVIRFFGLILIAVSVIAPSMTAIGYAEAGNAMLYPTILSMLVLGLVMVLQRFAADVYGLITGQGVEARDSLMAIFAGFVLVLASLPFLALLWGARVTDLTELWRRFLDGFEIGGTRISPSDFLTFAIVFVIGYTVTRLLQGTLRTNVLPKTRLDIGGQNALISGIGYVGIFLASLIAVTVAGVDLSAFAIVAGALSVGIGFGLQTIVSNFVSGIILLVERPISEGDWIEVGGQMGVVKHISVRSTRIETFDRTDVIVPNSDLIAGTVTNYTRGNTIGRLIVKIGVAYGTDTKRVDRILREIANAQPMVLNNPPPNVVFMGFGADSLDFEIRAILRDVNWILSVQNDINHEIAARFTEEGIEIPFAQRDVWLRNPEVLQTGSDKSE
ncbi:Small-conductance mechanosensitive channel [Roseobacter denitrificans OCh 114]|nr:DUF3772 domain-containing protein [Roseobacter denitrificans]SFG42526.1 Small-conductance mechanosensitive channel [Roseobacter denitrificans OCh 114]